jgi:hypothetical protein
VAFPTRTKQCPPVGDTLSAPFAPSASHHFQISPRSSSSSLPATVSLHCSTPPALNKSPTRRPPPISPRESTSSPLRQCALIRPPRFLRQAMDRRLRGSPRAAGRDNRHHHNQRFLRPGALARLRDSRIVARSLRSSACLLLPRPVPAPPPVSAEQGGVPRFLGAGGWGPGRYPLRRRVAAARGAFFSPPSSPDPEAFLDALAP